MRLSLKTHTGWNLNIKSLSQGEKAMSHQLLRHIFGTLYRRQRIFCVLIYGGPTSTRVIWLMVVLRRARTAGDTASRERATVKPSNHRSQKKKKVYKKFSGQSTTISHHLKNVVNSGLWQIEPVTRAVAFSAAAKPCWPEFSPRLLDPHKNP